MSHQQCVDIASPDEGNGKDSFVINLYIFSRRVCLGGISFFARLFEAFFNGFWLGLLSKKALDLVNNYYYNHANLYFQDYHNKKGLFKWEEEMINQYFQKCKSILIAAVGGGRELLALHNLGYEVDAFECNTSLARSASKLIRNEGISAEVKLVPVDKCPESDKVYDGLIVGWGGYMSIQGRKRRVAFLRKMRDCARKGAPVLISFYYRNYQRFYWFYFRTVVLIGNLLRWVLRRECLEVGDDLHYNFVHNFTKEEIICEFQEAGFDLVHFGTQSYGHAVGLANG